MDSDRVLLNKAAQGCKESLRQIYETHKDHLLTLARGMTGDRGEAEDIVHDVFVAFARNVPGLHLRTSLRAYLSVSVCNRARDLAGRGFGIVRMRVPIEPASEWWRGRMPRRPRRSWSSGCGGPGAAAGGSAGGRAPAKPGRAVLQGDCAAPGHHGQYRPGPLPIRNRQTAVITE